MRKMFVFLSVLTMASNFALASDQAVAKLTFKVVDEDARPIEGAEVRMGFEQHFQANKNISIKGLTDSNGLFTAQAQTSGRVGGGIWMNGCYPSLNIVNEFGLNDKERWLLENAVVTVVVKRIINPIPMFAQRVRKDIPVTGEVVGYDLMIGDWVAPHGKGIVSDFHFLFNGMFNNLNDRTESLSLSFSNKGDGIRKVTLPPNSGSVLRLPHQAPEGGYQTEWSSLKVRRPDGNHINQGVHPEDNFIFRVRTTLDEEGQIKETKYGKIHGEVEFGFSSSNKAMVIFTYYLNPDGTRNIEFDPKKNLLTGIESFESPNAP